MSPKSLRSTMRCAICAREISYHQTDLPDIESALRRHHPAASSYGEGWTRNVSSEWACKSCITEGLALKGNPSKQNFMGYSGPYFAYWDKAGQCEYCSQGFVFTAAEQRYLYEEARFHPKSRPVGCQNCRSIIGKRKTAQRRLQISIGLPR